MSRLTWSRFGRIFQTLDRLCVFHSLAPDPIFVALDVLPALRAFMRKPHSATDAHRIVSDAVSESEFAALVAELHGRQILIAGDAEDKAFLETRRESWAKGRPFRLMYLLTTAQCNLHCGYCYVEEPGAARPRASSGTMPEATARLAVEKFFALSPELTERRIIFYGGEPLANREAVYAAASHARELEGTGVIGGTVELVLLTNGTLVTDHDVRALASLGVHVSISIDGPQDLHDAGRRSWNGGGSHAKAVSAFRRLADAGQSPSVSCTVSDANIGEFDRVVRYFVDELRPAAVGFNLLRPDSSGLIKGTLSDDEAIQVVISGFQELRAAGIYESRVMRRTRALVERRFRFADCQGVGGQIVVDASGAVGPCQGHQGNRSRFPLRLTDLDLDRVRAEPLFAEWHRRVPINMPQCQDCDVIAVCGGGCPYAAEVSQGSIWETDPTICRQVRAIFEFLVEELSTTVGSRASR